MKIGKGILPEGIAKDEGRAVKPPVSPESSGTSSWPESEVGTESGEAEEKAPIPSIAKLIKTLVL